MYFLFLKNIFKITISQKIGLSGALASSHSLVEIVLYFQAAGLELIMRGVCAGSLFQEILKSFQENMQVSLLFSEASDS